MAVGDQPDEQAIHEIMLSDNDAAISVAAVSRAEFPDVFVDGLNGRVRAGGRRDVGRATGAGAGMAWRVGW